MARPLVVLVSAFLACWPAQARETLFYCVDPDWPPYEVINERGEHQGIAADLLAVVAARSGLDLRLVPTTSWAQSLDFARTDRCQALSFLNSSPERQKWLVFTDPLFADPNVILTHEQSPDIADLSTVGEKVLALPQGTAIEEWVRRDFPALRIVTTPDEDAAFAMVSNHQADLTLRSLTVAVHAIKRRGWFNLKVAGRVAGYDNLLRLGLRPGAAHLVPVLNQGIAALSPQERAEIANRHAPITVRAGVDLETVRAMVVAAAVLLLTSLFWAGKLKAVNARLRQQSRSDGLTGLGNRSFLNEILTREISRAQRGNGVLSLILIDVDHFKHINDGFGHLVGDQILVEMAQALLSQARQTDAIGRWGGEEFLVICPDTDQGQALVLAERIRQAVRNHVFATGAVHTISAGLAQLRPGEAADSILARADRGLYRAKDQGRDQVVAAP